MRDLVVILLVALLGTGAALWALRRRPDAPPTPTYAPDEASVRQQSPSAAASPINASNTARASAATAAGMPARPEAVNPSGAPLAVLEFDSPPWSVAMTTPEVVIGRHSQDDIRITDVRVSRHHAKLIARREGGFEIHNLTSVRSEPNPMLVNGEPREHADIDDGDVVTLGGVSFTFKPAT